MRREERTSKKKGSSPEKECASREREQGSDGKEHGAEKRNKNGSPAKQNTIRRLMVHQGASSFGNSVAGPFVPYYAARLGASASQMGWLNALSTLIPNVLQYPWARFSDLVKRRLPFIIFGAILIGLMFLALVGALDVTVVIIIVMVQALGTAIISPTWSALMGDVVPEGRRGVVFSRLNVAARSVGIFGLVAAGIFVLFAPPTDAKIYHVGFVIGCIALFLAAASLVTLREPKVEKEEPAEENGRRDERWADFKYFLKAQAVFTFFMAFAWPLFPLTVVNVIGASNLDIVLLSVASVIPAILFQFAIGRAVDRIGPVGFVWTSRFMLVLVPVVYGLATNIYWLYGLNIALGVVDAMIGVAMVTYILDLAPCNKRAEYFAVYSTVIGVVTFAGALIGGYLAGYLEGYMDLFHALLAVYFISSVGRFAGAVMHLKLRDPKKYPEKASMSEYVRYQILQLRMALRRQ